MFGNDHDDDTREVRGPLYRRPRGSVEDRLDAAMANERRTGYDRRGGARRLARHLAGVR